jgi:chaperonin GroEL
MTRTSNPWQTPQVIFNPAVYRGMQRGIDQVVNAIRPTLGPLPRVVANVNARTGRPEVLDNGAIIARRIFQLPNRQADVGAMYVRHLLWRLHEAVGDGTATAAVLFQAIYHHGIRYVAAGGDAVRLRQHLEAAAGLIQEQLAARPLQVEGHAAIARLAAAIGADQEVSAALGEIFDLIGPYGRLEVRTGRSRQVERQYVEGHYWDGALVSPRMVTDDIRQRAQLEQPAILLSNLEVREPRDLIPAMEAALATGSRALLLVVKALPEPAIAVLLMPPNRERLLVAAVKTPGSDLTATRDALHDLAVLTGGRPLLQEAGDQLDQVRPDDLGQARRGWADAEFFGIVGGRGDPVQLRRHVASLRAAYAASDDLDQRRRLLERLGKLLGGTAVLWVGDDSPTAIELRKEQAIRTAQALRGALREGVVPGGGVALLECIPPLEQRLHAALEPAERAAYHILIQALEAPARTIFSNAGCDPAEVVAMLRHAGPGQGFDVVRRQVVDMVQAGIVDPAAVVQAAVDGAIRSAALALTIEVLVHRANPPDSATNP